MEHHRCLSDAHGDKTGFAHRFPHRALADVVTTLTVVIATVLATLALPAAPASAATVEASGTVSFGAAETLKFVS
jgi:hypothetical protein